MGHSNVKSKGYFKNLIKQAIRASKNLLLLGPQGSLTYVTHVNHESIQLVECYRVEDNIPAQDERMISSRNASPFAILFLSLCNTELNMLRQKSG